jgi:hypothetical protein
MRPGKGKPFLAATSQHAVALADFSDSGEMATMNDAMLKWSLSELRSMPPMSPHRIRYIRNDRVYECMRYQEADLEDREGIVVVARDAEEWHQFVRGQILIDIEWNKRRFLTIEDMKFLSACGIAWSKSISWLSACLQVTDRKVGFSQSSLGRAGTQECERRYEARSRIHEFTLPLFLRPPLCLGALPSFSR